MHPTHLYGRGERPHVISLKFTAAGMPCEVYLGPEPHLVAEVPAHEGHRCHRPAAGHDRPRVWLSPDAEPMCCCEDWWAARQCRHIAVALAVISGIETVTR